MEPVVSSPILIAQIPIPRFSEEHMDEYRDEAAEIMVEHPLPMDIFDLLDDSLSPYHASPYHASPYHASPTTPLLSPPSCWDRFWWCVCQVCCC